MNGRGARRFLGIQSNLLVEEWDQLVEVLDQLVEVLD